MPAHLTHTQPHHPHSPRGRYGATEGLSSRTCTAKCPTGKYNDRLGARTDEDCFDCPPGRYGDTAGLTTEDCSGWCPSGTYNAFAGLTTADDCVDCPTGYRGWQCDGDGHHFDVDQAPRRGYWDSTDGNINEKSHAYIKTDAGLSRVTSPVLPLNILLTILSLCFPQPRFRRARLRLHSIISTHHWRTRTPTTRTQSAGLLQTAEAVSRNHMWDEFETSSPVRGGDPGRPTPRGTCMAPFAVLVYEIRNRGYAASPPAVPVPSQAHLAVL